MKNPPVSAETVMKQLDSYELTVKTWNAKLDALYKQIKEKWSKEEDERTVKTR